MRLTELTPAMEKLYSDYISEWRAANETIIPLSADPKCEDFESLLDYWRDAKHPETCPKNFVPSDTYFAIDENNKLVGAINIRHQLNDYLLKKGGHIGYGVRPSERRKGYATAMLRLALKKCKNLGINKVLITCDKDNPASARTILANGGVLENEIPDESRITQRYWIEL